MVGLAVPTSPLANLLKPVAAALKPPAPAAPTALQVIKNINTATGLTFVTPPTLAQSIVSTSQNLFQKYEMQSYNADGTHTTKTIPFGELVKTTTENFTPENAANFTQLQQTEAKLLPSTLYNANQRNAIIQDSLKVDYFLCIKSQESQALEFNNTKTPSMTIDQTYNFYTDDERDILTQEDQSQDPLLSGSIPPRYVTLRWDVVDSDDSAGNDFAPRTQAEKQLVNSYLSLPRGTATLSNSPTVNAFKNNLSQVAPIFRDGISLQLVDTHDMERGFKSTSNSRLFKNAALTVLNLNAVDLNRVSVSEILKDSLDG